VSADVTLLIWINQGWADPGLDFLFHWVSTRLGFSFPLLVGLLLYLRRQFQQDGIKLWLLLILTVIVGDMLGNLLKAYFAMPRPCYELFESLRPPGGGAPRQCDAPTTGMPSNHALNFFAVAAFLAYSIRHKALSLLMLTLALAVGLSRIYLAKHYPSQVLAGAATGGLFGWLFAWLGLRTFAFGQRFLQRDRFEEQRRLAPADVSLLQRLLAPPSAGQKGGQAHSLLVWLPLGLSLLGILLVWLTDSNQTLFLGLNRLGLLTSDGLWSALTLFGDTLVALALLGPFVRHRPEMFKAILLTLLLATLWVHGLKPLLDQPRPLAVLAPDQIHLIGHALHRHAFPSGHTTTAFAFAGMILISRVHPGLTVPLLALACLAGLSRAVVGAHWPLDILAGAFGGWLSALLGIRLARPGSWQPGRWSTLGLLIVLSGCALALLISRDLGYPQAIPLQMLIGLITLTYLLKQMRWAWQR
jgi:membrane-associated phospholipid phosphatase